MNKIGFTTVTFRQKTRREIAELAKENDIRYIEWGGDIHLPPQDKAALAEVIALQKEFGLTALSYGSYYRLGQEDYPLFTDIVSTAKAIGANIIRIWQGSVGSGLTDLKTLAAMVKEMQQLCDIAAKENIEVACEFHHNTNNDNGKSALDFIRAVDRKNVKTYWQPFSTEEDLPNLEAVLPYLAVIHVFEWNTAYDRYPLADGVDKWNGIFSAVDKAGVTPHYIMEFVKDDCDKQFADDVKVLKSMR